jgi:SlyX protein
MDADLEDLQIRMTHQDLAIESLNDTVARQDRLIAQLQQELQQLRELVRELRPSPLGDAAADEPPPPHY